MDSWKCFFILGRLRHELNECRLVTETRDNELLDEIRLLQRRVEELDMQCRVQQGYSPTTGVPYPSHEQLRESSQPDSEHEREEQDQQIQAESYTPSDPIHVLVPDTADEDNRIRTIMPITTELPTVELHQPPSRGVITQPPPTHTWLQLNDSELDGLLDAIDGEASMELATPLMPSSLLARDGEDYQVHFESDHEPGFQNQESDQDLDHNKELMIWDELDERLGDNVQSGYGHADEDDGAETSEDGSRSESLVEGTLYSDDVGECEHWEEQHASPGDPGQRGWMTPGDDSVHDDPADSIARAQLASEGTEEGQLGDANLDVHRDERHCTHGRDDLRNSRLPQQEQEEVLEVGPTRSPTRNTHSESLGLAFVFPHSPTTFSTTHPDSRSHLRSRSSSSSSSVSPTATTGGLRLELERAERELTVAQEMLEQGEDALRDVEATIRMGSFSPPSSET